MPVTSTNKDKFYRENKDKNTPTSKTYLISAFKAKPSAMEDINLDDAENIEDERLGILQEAELLIEQINEDILSVGRLSASQKKAIFYYLSIYRYNNFFSSFIINFLNIS